MGKFRHLGIECLVDIDLARSIVNMILASYHMGDPHIIIIYNHTEIIGRSTVGSSDNQIIKFTVADFNIAADVIVELDCTLGRILESYTVRFIR